MGIVHNRRGERVDPVPFLVVSGLALLGWYSFGPIYLVAYGLDLAAGLVAVTLLSGVSVAVAYQRFVREATTERGPPGPRLLRIYYGAAALGVLLVAVTLPLL